MKNQFAQIIKKLEASIKSIEARNKRVEADKSWETSYIRRIILTIFTYLAVALYLRIINIQRPWLNAIVPAVAFMLSTLTMPMFKKLWIKYVYKKKISGHDV